MATPVVTEATKRYIVPLTGKSWIYAYPYQVNAFGVTEIADRAWADTVASLAELNEQVTRDGATLVLAAFPYQFQVSDDPRDNPYGVDPSLFVIDPLERLESFSQQAGITFVDLRQHYSANRRRMLENREDWDPLYIDFCHPNELGQAIAASAIYDRLVEMHLLD